MATTTGRNRCVTCGKDKVTFKCGGCLQEFCFNHLGDHQQELSQKLDEVEVTCKLFQQALIEQTAGPQNHTLIQKINDWEQDSIEKIRQTAEAARQTLHKYTIEHIIQVEIDLNKLTDQLRQSRQENDFYETDLRNWNEELTRLTKELATPSNINFRKDTSSLINKISVDITSAVSAQTAKRDIPPPPPTTEDEIFGDAASKGENFGKYHRAQVRCTPAGKLKPLELCEEANFGTQLLSNIRRAHFEKLTPVQRYTIPCIRQQDDIMACAQTGSGKTAAFLLPIISNLLEYHADILLEKPYLPSPLCLILSPTRELALQTEREAQKFTYQTAVIPCSVVDGLDMFAVSDRLRDGCHILSTTNERLKDMVEKGRISLKRVKYLVLDRADQILESDIRKLADLGLPPKYERFTSMFSATFSDHVQKMAKHFLRENYISLVVGTLGGANEDIAQTVEEVPRLNKKDRLFQLLKQNLKSEPWLIFVEEKRSADYIGALLSQKKPMCTTVHNDRTQKQRSEAVQQFTSGKCPILVATSAVAHELHFSLAGNVVIYDLPDSVDVYVHCIGRTGRAGRFAKSISFFDPDRDSDRKIAPYLISKLNKDGQEVPEFLQRYADTRYSQSVYGARNTDFSSRTPAVNLSGVTSYGGVVEDDGD